MDFKSQQGAARPQPQQATNQPSQPKVSNEPVSKPVQAGNMKSSSEGNALGKIIGIIVAIAIIVVAGLAAWHYIKGSTADTTADSKAYQAVFLTNGQVYFGKLKSLEGDYVTLTDIYYLQVQRAVQPKTGNNEEDTISLNKLGGELHGPTDEMHISKDQILFWENLKQESAVTKAIANKQETN